MHDAVNSAHSPVFVELFVFNDPAKVSARARPFAFLNNTVVHIDNIKAAVGTGIGIQRSEIRVGRRQPLFFLINTANLEFAVYVADAAPFNNPPHRLCYKIIALHICRKAVATKYGLPADGSQMVQRVIFRTKGLNPALGIQISDNGPGNRKIFGILIFKIKHTVFWHL